MLRKQMRMESCKKEMDRREDLSKEKARMMKKMRREIKMHLMRVRDKNKRRQMITKELI